MKLDTFPTFVRQMQNKQYILNSTLRFTKWSRKSYAVFLTIGREVTIGVLAVQLCLRLINKIIQGLKSTFLRLDDQEEEVGLEEELFERSSSCSWLFCFMGVDVRNTCTFNSFLLKADLGQFIHLRPLFLRSVFSFFPRFLKRIYFQPSGNFSIIFKPKTKINEFKNSIDGYCCLTFLCRNCYRTTSG